MKYILILLGLTAGIPWLLHQLPANVLPTPPKTKDISSNGQNLKTISYQNQVYRYDYFLTDNNPVTAVDNLKAKSPSSDLKALHNCQKGVSGGFYDTSYQPIGLLTIEASQISKYRQNRLFDGIISSSDSATFTITQDPPAKSQLAIQAGPRLVENRQTRKLSINNDEFERRIIATTLDTSDTAFFIIISAESAFAGPKLADTPGLIAAIADQENLSITAALNLDGGSASTLFYDDIAYPELKTIGTLICIQ